MSKRYEVMLYSFCDTLLESDQMVSRTEILNFAYCMKFILLFSFWFNLFPWLSLDLHCHWQVSFCIRTEYFLYIDWFIYFSARTSGTTVTFVIIDRWVITVASVGDSRCILESAEGAIYSLSADHRLEENEPE